MTKPPFRPAGLDHLVLRVADAPRMIAFYRDVVGCTVDREVPDLGLTHLRVGASMLDLVALDGKLGAAGGAGPGPEGRNLDHFCVVARDFDAAAARAWLTANGVEVVDAGDRYGAGGTGYSLYFQDPEGNTVELKAA